MNIISLKRFNLRNKLMFTVLPLVLAAIAVLAVFTHNSLETALKAEIREDIRYKTESLAGHVASWIRMQKLNLESFSEDEIYLTATEDSFKGKAARIAATKKLSGIIEHYNYYEFMGLTDLTGEVIAASNEKKVGVTIADRQYFKDVLKLDKGSLISGAVKSRASGKPIFVILKQLRDKGKPVGVFFAVVKLYSFTEQFIVPVKVGKSGYAYMYGKDGLLLAHPNPDHILQLNMNELDFGPKMLKMGNGEMEYRFEGSDKYTIFRKIDGTDWSIATAMEIKEIFTPVYKLTRSILLIAGVTALLLGAVLVWLANSIVRPVINIAHGLNEVSVQVASAASQVSSASHSLADGSSEQAASVEETASSLEEMSSMTQRNAENSNETNRLMHEEAGPNFELITRRTEQADRSIEEAVKTGEEMSVIIKTIDEIAFQTNLLALNAAVEAARAGEAGAGFAVVADEVRNLALRAAEAAKQTNDLIKMQNEKNAEVQNMNRQVAEALAVNNDLAGKMATLVDEVSHASREQSDGIKQINDAVANMDRIVQQNAANAEETASASEELSAQAEQMKALIENLRRTVDGDKSDASPDRVYSTPMDRTGTAASVERGPVTAAQKALPSVGGKMNERTRIASSKGRGKEAA